jgi:SAM-dependent methyltransferase
VRATTERFDPAAAESPDEVVVALILRYAYHAAAELIVSGDRVLDVGFGAGYGSEILSAAGADYLGIELDPDVVEDARNRYPFSFESYDGTSIPANDDAFDVVTAFQVIEHIRDPTPWLGEIRRVTRPGGTAIFTTPNRLHRGLEEGERPWNRHHFREYTPRELAAQLEQCFAEVRLFGVRGPDIMESIYRARSNRARRLARLDRLGLRYRLPEQLDARLRRALRHASRQSDVDRSELQVDRMWHEEPAEPGFDLFAVAR